MPRLKKQTNVSDAKEMHYHLCPRCYRAVPAHAQESFCPNDGTQLLRACPNCDSSILSPYSRFCTVCGQALGSA